MRTEEVENIHLIHKWKYSCFSLRCIYNRESIDECQIETNKFVKPWVQKELSALPPFANFTDAEFHNEVVVIDKYYDRVSNMVREGNVFIVIAPIYNPENVHYCLLRCIRSKSILLQ